MKTEYNVSSHELSQDIAPKQLKQPSSPETAERAALTAEQQERYDTARKSGFTHDSAMWQAKSGYKPGGAGVGTSLGHAATYKH